MSCARFAALMLIVAAGCAAAPAAQPATQPAQPPQPIAPSRITAVTVYQTNALVTREVTVPAGAGVAELVVGPLPASTVDSSLHAEGNDGLRVLTTRYRTRVVRESTLDEVRKLEQQLKDVRADIQQLQKQAQTEQENLQLLTKLETFTTASMKDITEKGQLNAEGVTTLAKYIMENREQRARKTVEVQQEIADNQEQEQYLQREMARIASGADRTVREAVIVVDNEKGQAGAVHLNYLVSAASWRPQYRLRATDNQADVQLEYLAAISQQSGEDWRGVKLVLSTAQPSLNAAPPELAILEIRTAQQAAQQAEQIMVDGNRLQRSSIANLKQADQLRQEAQFFANSANKSDAAKRWNEAGALLQSDEILNPDIIMEQRKQQAEVAFLEGQSVTFHLERPLTVPWREDEQLIEVARVQMKPEFFYNATPVLTPHVYRLAKLTNTSKYVLLPGEVTVYIGTDFVGRAALPLVAIGEQFTAGFGVDPQLQAARQLVDKSRAIQGGNQVLTFNYRIRISSYKAEPVRVQVWDRLPHADTETVNVTLGNTDPKPSEDATYLREDRPEGLLRWDLEVPPGSTGEKAKVVTYQFKLEYARDANITRFDSRKR